MPVFRKTWLVARLNDKNRIPRPKIDRQSALQTAQKENTDRIPFTLTFHPQNHAFKFIILENLKLSENDSKTGTIFSQPLLLFKCVCVRCKTCTLIHYVAKISADICHVHLINCITCTNCKKIYIAETGRRPGDRFREHHGDVVRNKEDASKPYSQTLLSH